MTILDATFTRKSMAKEREPYWAFNRTAIEQQYHANFIAELPLGLKGGGWSDWPAAIFFVPKLVKPEHKHHIGFFLDGAGMCVASAEPFDPWVDAMECDKTYEIIYSQYRHDFVESSNGKFFIDGGRDYLRFGGTGFTLGKFNVLSYVFRPNKEK